MELESITPVVCTFAAKSACVIRFFVLICRTRSPDTFRRPSRLMIFKCSPLLAM